jgi:hypothetical protein
MQIRSLEPQNPRYLADLLIYYGRQDGPGVAEAGRARATSGGSAGQPVAVVDLDWAHLGIRWSSKELRQIEAATLLFLDNLQPQFKLFQSTS